MAVTMLGCSGVVLGWMFEWAVAAFGLALWATGLTTAGLNLFISGLLVAVATGAACGFLRANRFRVWGR